MTTNTSPRRQTPRPATRRRGILPPTRPHHEQRLHPHRKCPATPSPTKGFLSHVEVGRFQSTAHTIAGAWWADILFMTGMAAIGTALVLGIGLRVAADSGALIMALMWLAEFPLARFTTTGESSGSTNPITDRHLIYAVVLVVLAAAYAGHTWGLGRIWARLPFVQRNRWMIAASVCWAAQRPSTRCCPFRLSWHSRRGCTNGWTHRHSRPACS